MDSVYSPSYNIAMLWCPKNACSVMRQFFYFVHPEDMKHEIKKGNKWHNIPLDYDRMPSPITPSYCVTRHPYSRAISMYCNAFIGQMHGVSEFSQILGHECKKTFRNFCYFLQKIQGKNIRINPHFRSQTSTSNVDWKNVYLIKLEDGDLEGDIRKAYKKILGEKFDEGLQRKFDDFFSSQYFSNRTRKSNIVYEENEAIDIVFQKGGLFPNPKFFINEELNNIIEIIFAQDYEILNYEKGLQNVKNLLAK